MTYNVNYAAAMRAALIDRLGKSNVVFLAKWDKQTRGIDWQGKGGVPVALMCHHTAGAATSSTNPKHPGNQKGANSGQVVYVNTHWSSPASNFVLDRDGTVYVTTLYPCWHSGKGSFRGVFPFDDLGVPNDQFQDYGLGVEIVSKGLKRDFTQAQKRALGRLANAAKDASGWPAFKMRLPNHKTWAGGRKSDTLYSESTLKLWATVEAAKHAFR
jgi:hypothetical protein